MSKRSRAFLLMLIGRLSSDGLKDCPLRQKWCLPPTANRMPRRPWLNIFATGLVGTLSFRHTNSGSTFNERGGYFYEIHLEYRACHRLDGWRVFPDIFDKDRRSRMA